MLPNSFFCAITRTNCAPPKKSPRTPLLSFIPCCFYFIINFFKGGAPPLQLAQGGGLWAQGPGPSSNPPLAVSLLLIFQGGGGVS